MKISENILREEYSYRGGGCELNLTEFGYEDELLSALPKLSRWWHAWLDW